MRNIFRRKLGDKNTSRNITIPVLDFSELPHTFPRSGSLAIAALGRMVAFRRPSPGHEAHAPPVCSPCQRQDEDAIRTAVKQRGADPPRSKLRRRFPDMSTAQARDCARILAGWKPRSPIAAAPAGHRSPAEPSK